MAYLMLVKTQHLTNVKNTITHFGTFSVHLQKHLTPLHFPIYHGTFALSLEISSLVLVGFPTNFQSHISLMELEYESLSKRVTS
jgi:hypothetical protein